MAKNNRVQSNLSEREVQLILGLLFNVTFLIFTAPNIAAHPGNTASDGCHFCRTNCGTWGYTYNTRHGHNGEICNPSNGPIDPLYSAPSPTSTPSPIPTTPAPTIPQATPTATITSTPTPTTTPSASVQLHGEKTDVLVGEDILFKLSAVNKITSPVMSVQVILSPPSGMSVTSSEFATSGAGQFTTTYKLEPGTGKDIEIRIKANQQGDFNVKGEIVYYYGDNKSTAEEHTLNLPIKVRLREISKTPTPAPQSSTLSFWVSLLLFGISYRLIKRDFNR